MSTPILATKLYIPPTRPELVPRPRLIERLNEGLRSDRKLTLISAPAGFGKTALAGSWIHDLQSDIADKDKIVNPKSKTCAERSRSIQNRVAWLSLDESDNDLARFLAYFIAALQIVDSSIGQMAQAVFQSQQRLIVEPILMTIVNEIAQLSGSRSENPGKDFILTLDDYHVIEEPSIHQVLEFLLEHQPPQLHLVILTRIDPPLPLSRLRARNQMVEIRGHNLHFTTKEAEVFLNQIMKLGLAPDEIDLLEKRTEGWIAGLQLAALALQGTLARQAPISMPSQTTPRDFIRTFSGDDRHVIDFLLDEVLFRQPKDIRRFLLQTAVLERMCGPLCDAVVNVSDEESLPDSQSVLEYLDRANLFIVPLDNQRKWYRYHHLFSGALLHRLRQTELARIPELHLRASEWYAGEDYHDQALYHALAAGDLERAAQLVEQNAVQLLTHSNLTTLMKWLGALPEDLIRSRPWLCIYRGWLHLLIGTVEDANRCVQDTEQLLSSAAPPEDIEDQEIYGHISIIKSHIALKNGELQKADEFAHQTLDYLSERHPGHSHVAVIKGLVAYWNGDLEAADQALRQAVSVAQDCDHRFMTVEATIWLGYIKTLQGHLHQAVRLYRDALVLADLGEKRKLPIAGSAYIGLALVEREWNNLEVAESLLMDGYELCALFGNPQPWHIAMAYVQSAQGNQVDAFDEIRKAERMEIGPDVAFAHLNIDIGRVCLWLSSGEGNLAEAVRWAEDSGLKADDTPSFSQRIAYTMLARVLMAQGEPDKAYGLLDRLRDDADRSGRNGDLIEILALQALSLQAQGDTDQAITTLEKALALAEPGGFIRIFVDEGLPMAHLLYEAATHGIMPDYTGKLLAAFPDFEAIPATQSETCAERRSKSASRSIQNPKSEIVEPLSERETELLLFIDQGLSYQEIADKLYISRNTVKVHARNIYGKLGVNNRSQAGAKARALGILSFE